MDSPPTNNIDTTPEPPPRAAALLLISAHCPHCQAALSRLSTLVKEGVIRRLTVINLSSEPDAPEAAGVRSVPWTRIGPFELSGALTGEELSEWAEIAAGDGGWGRYYAHLIETHRLAVVIDSIGSRPHTLQDLITLFADTQTPLSVRIGISAIMEGLAGTEILRDTVPELIQLTLSPSHQIRADACYFIGLAGDPAALPSIERLLDDEQPEVREVATEITVLLQGAEGA